MAKFDLEIVTRDIDIGISAGRVSDVVRTRILCEYADDQEPNNGYSVVATTDRSRDITTSDVQSDVVVKTDAGAGSYGMIRNDILIAHVSGLHGSVLSYTINKKVPTTGAFKFFGVETQLVDLPVVNEFTVSSGAIQRMYS
jgi:hypothetical protein